MILKLSAHKQKHLDEKWNQVTIRQAIYDGDLYPRLIEGDTADVLYGFVDGECVGLIVSKECNGCRVIITGFEADESYWLRV